MLTSLVSPWICPTQILLRPILLSCLEGDLISCGGTVLTYCFMLITYNTPSSSLDMGYDDLSAVGPYNQGNYSVNTKIIARK